MSPAPYRTRIEDQVEALAAFASRRPLVDRDRTQGQAPLSIEAVGDLRFYWGASGGVAAGGTETFYLTYNGAVGGERLFSKTPEVVVYRDAAATGGGLPRAASPLTPEASLRLAPHSDWEYVWDGANERAKVVVTNSTGATTGFVVTARGL